MKIKTNGELPAKFSNDPGKNLRIENEILRIKLQAQAGAVIGIKDDMPPELENVFLHNVIAFEEASREIKMINVYDYLGRPDFKRLDELPPGKLPDELRRLKQLLEDKKIMLDVLDIYEDAAIYQFITEELFAQQTYETLLPGMMRHFTYEDFHPSHKLDIRERTMDFLGNWFERKIDEQCWELGPEFVLPDATVVKREEVIRKIKTIFAACKAFRKCQYAIGEISFEWNDGQPKGLGFCEGAVKYQAVLENGEEVPVEGPFKLYMTNLGGWWNIFYFIFPGFTW
jgi:hypothetical protein